MTIKIEENESNVQRRRLFGTNGVRGIYGRELTLPLVIDLTYSLATYFKTGPIVVGFDGRNSSPILSNIVSAVLNSGGIDVMMAGQIPTPCLQFAAKTKNFRGGIMITASHNPPEYNGIKPCAEDGVEISREDELKVEEIFYNRQFSKIDQTNKTFADQNIVNEYMEKVLSLIDVEKIKSKSFKVVMDLGNGVQTMVAPYLLEKLGCEVFTLNSNIDGDFPGRGPEPTVDNLTSLSNMVRDLHADFGVAYDGDGDRSLFCDEKGIIHPGDKTAAVLVKYLINGKHNGAEIICPLNTTLNVQLVADEGNSNIVYTKVGSVEVSREMIKRNALIGLEENGGFMYGKLNQVRDGAMTTGLVLDMLANFSTINKSSNPFSEIIGSLKKIAQFKTKFKCSSKEVANKIVTKCLEHGSPKKIEKLDGAKIWIDDESWIMVRPSGTEPLVRMYGESISQTLLDSKVREYTRIIESVLQ
ncbi:MAG TPA: phosphoglucosamine mutase [Nitrososphaeraceae archaeon]|nr:phosphoglucosamine mutase [Nitrososphaeraceae archaeon]